MKKQKRVILGCVTVVFVFLLLSGCTAIGYAYYNYVFYEQSDEEYTFLTARIRVVNDGYAKGVDTHPIWWHLVIDTANYSFYSYEYLPAVVDPRGEEIFSIIFRIPITMATGDRSLYYDKSGDVEYVLYNESLAVNSQL